MQSHLRSFALIALFGLALLAACNDGGNPALEVTVEPGKVTCEPLELFKSYRFHSVYTVEVRPPDPSSPGTDTSASPGFKFAFEQEGAVQGTDRVEGKIVSIMDDVTNPEIMVVAIGKTYWLRSAGGWTEHSDSKPFLYEPLSLCGSLAPDLDLGGLTGEPDTVGKVKARKYHFDALTSDFAKRSEYFGPSSDTGRLVSEYEVDVWVAEEGSCIVRMDIAGVGVYENGSKLTTSVSYEVQDIDDKDIRIVPPDI